jgi:hypothetical protein
MLQGIKKLIGFISAGLRIKQIAEDNHQRSFMNQFRNLMQGFA